MISKTKQLFYLNNAKLKKVILTGLGINILGIADSIYLTIAHFTQASILACPSTSFINCDVVTTSSYSEFFGIPVAIFGLVFFIVMTGLLLPIFWSKKYSFLKIPRLVLAGLGLVGIFWFIYVELDKLNKICLYCTAAHILILLSFIVIVVASEMSNQSISAAQEKIGGK
jgi:uncharacterized membrane protein